MASSFLLKDENPKGPIVFAYDNNLSSPNTFKLLETLAKNKWNYKILGIGEQWKGFQSKMNGYAKEIEERMKQNENEERIYVISDARDVFCLRPADNFEESFIHLVGGEENAKNKMVVSMEIFCDGKTDVPEEYVGHQCVSLKKYWEHHHIESKNLLPIRKFVNSGLICGKAKVLNEFYKFYVNNHKFHKGDDQLALGLFMNLFPEKVVADVDAVLLHTCVSGVNAGLQSIEKQNFDAPSLSELAGHKAFFLHIPGLHCIKGQRTYYSTVSKFI